MTTAQSQFDCVLWGGYAAGNTGDELLLALALKDARQRFGDSVAVLSPSPSYTKWLFPHAHVIPYELRPSSAWRRRVYWFNQAMRRRGYSPFQFELFRLRDQLAGVDGRQVPWTDSIRNSKHLYLVGGGYLTDLLDWEEFLMPIRAAKSFGIPIGSAPIGLGPFQSDAVARKVAEALAGAELVVRDDVSMDLCRGCGLNAGRRADDGFRLFECMPELRRQKHRRLVDTARAPAIGVCVYPQHGSVAFPRLEPWWVQFLKAMQQQIPQCTLQGFCFHIDPQLDFSTTVRLFSLAGLEARQVDPPRMDFREAIRSLTSMDVIIATRFHAVVAARVLHIPCLAISTGKYYNAKMATAVSPNEPWCRLVDPTDCSATAAAESVAAILQSATISHPAELNSK